MAEKTGKTGIQMIEELLGNFVLMDRRLQVVEQLLKQLLAANNSNACCAPTNKEETRAIISEPARVAPEPLIKAAPNARVIGKIMDGGKPVSEVGITIYDDINNAVKKTRTNRSGEWMAQLPPGRYVAECLLEGRINGNVVFNVENGAKIVRVGQPQ